MTMGGCPWSQVGHNIDNGKVTAGGHLRVHHPRRSCRGPSEPRLDHGARPHDPKEARESVTSTAHSATHPHSPRTPPILVPLGSRPSSASRHTRPQCVQPHPKRGGGTGGGVASGHPWDNGFTTEKDIVT